jgi:hypothetical protein
MNRLLRFLLLGAFFLSAGAAHAQIDNATTESLLRKSGLWEQVGSIAAQADAGLSGMFAQAATKPSAEEIERISRVVRESYSAQRLRAVSVGIVSKKLGAQHVAALLRWFDSPLGQTITKLEEEASAASGDPQALMQQGVALLKKSAPARSELLKELLKETRSAEVMIQITINTSLAALRGAASVSPQTPAMSAEELKAALEAQRPQLMQAFSAMALAGFARAYEALSTEQLRSYVAFLKSKAGKHYDEVCMQALEAALTEAATELGRRLPSTKDQANT